MNFSRAVSSCICVWMLCSSSNRGSYLLVFEAWKGQSANGRDICVGFVFVSIRGGDDPAT